MWAAALLLRAAELRAAELRSAVCTPSASHCCTAAAGPCPVPQVNLGSLQQQLAALQLQSGGERISPTLDAILELLEEAPGDGAAAAADDFVWQVAAGVAAAAGSDATAPMHQAEGGEGEAAAAQGEEEGEEEGGVEGVIAEYAHAAPPEPADMPAGEGRLCVHSSWVGCRWQVGEAGGVNREAGGQRRAVGEA